MTEICDAFIKQTCLPQRNIKSKMLHYFFNCSKILLICKCKYEQNHTFKSKHEKIIVGNYALPVGSNFVAGHILSLLWVAISPSAKEM